MDKTSGDHEFVQGVVVVTLPWDGGIDKGEDLLDAEVAILEGAVKGKGTNNGPVPPVGRVGVMVGEVVPDFGWNVNVAEGLGRRVIVGGGAE